MEDWSSRESLLQSPALLLGSSSAGALPHRATVMRSAQHDPSCIISCSAAQDPINKIIISAHMFPAEHDHKKCDRNSTAQRASPASVQDACDANVMVTMQ